MLVRVAAPHFVAGIVLDDAGVVIEAAPILAWERGKHYGELRAYFARKHWVAERCES